MEMDSSTQLPVPPSRFFADAMLGKLARWLRILGYDTAYEKVIEDEQLVERVLGEGRWLLTRDGYLAKRKIVRGRHTLIVSDRLDDQLRQLKLALHLTLDLGEQTVSRCAECNRILEAVSQEEAECRVPPFVAATCSAFTRCRHCNRIYWPGTHWTNVLARLTQLRQEAEEPKPST